MKLLSPKFASVIFKTSLVELPTKIQIEVHKHDFVAKVALILCYTGLRPIELLTAAGKNRIIPLAEKILPFISEMYNPKNDFLVMPNGKPIDYQNFLQSYWRKNEILKSLPLNICHTTDDTLALQC